jgi:hypothetical protein
MWWWHVDEGGYEWWCLTAGHPSTPCRSTSSQLSVGLSVKLSSTSPLVTAENLRGKSSRSCYCRNGIWMNTVLIQPHLVLHILISKLFIVIIIDNYWSSHETMSPPRSRNSLLDYPSALSSKHSPVLPMISEMLDQAPSWCPPFHSHCTTLPLPTTKRSYISGPPILDL